MPDETIAPKEPWVHLRLPDVLLQEVELFDLQSDPLEKMNLAPNRAEEVKRLEAIQQNA